METKEKKMCYITSVINNLFSMFDAGLTVEEIHKNYEYYSLSMISAAHDWWEAVREEEIKEDQADA